MRYFSTQRPLTPGAFPKPSDNRVIAVENFDTYDGRMFCPAVSRLAYGYVDYEKPLTEEQSSDYELIPQKFPAVCQNIRWLYRCSDRFGIRRISNLSFSRRRAGCRSVRD